MNGSLQSQLLQTLQSRRDRIVESLHEALARTSFVPLGAAEIRQHLAELTTQAIALLVAEPFERHQAEAIGASFVRLRYAQPESLGHIQEVLARELVEGLPAEQAAGLQPRLAALLGGTAAGFLRQACDTVLAEQEQTHQALLTAHEQAVVALRESEEMAHALLNAVTDAEMLMEPDGTIVALNQAAAESLGRRADELIGTCVFDLLPPDVAAYRKAMCDRGVRSGEPVHFTDQHRGRWFDHTVYPALDSQGQVARLAIFVRDITEHKRTLETLRRQAERLRVLHRVDTAILTAQSPEEITKTVLDHVRPLVFYLGAGVVLFDFEAHEGTVLYAEVASTVKIPPGTRFSLDMLPGVEVAIEALQQGEIYTTEKILTLAQAMPALQILHAEGMRAALLVPLIAQEELIGLFALGTDKLDVFGENQIRIIRELADPLAIAIQQARLFQSVKRQGERLRALSARLAEAEETERQRLARELHDQVGQNLTALGINLNLVRTHMPKETPELMRARLDESLALIEETTARVRLVMADLRPPMLDDFGLVATLQWHGTRFASHMGISVTVRGEEPVPRLPAPTENALFRIAQEALTNVAKHAQATQVTIAVQVDDKIVRLMIADDGIGFDPTSPAKPNGDRGWGLITITERAEAVGGRCRIESKSQQGTRVIVEVTR